MSSGVVQTLAKKTLGVEVLVPFDAMCTIRCGPDLTSLEYCRGATWCRGGMFLAQTILNSPQNKGLVKATKPHKTIGAVEKGWGRFFFWGGGGVPIIPCTLSGITGNAFFAIFSLVGYVCEHFRECAPRVL